MCPSLLVLGGGNPGLGKIALLAMGITLSLS